MKLITNKKRLGETPETWLRRAGYGLIPEREDGQISFARRFTRDFYPRFHIYFLEQRSANGEDYEALDPFVQKEGGGLFFEFWNMLKIERLSNENSSWN